MGKSVAYGKYCRRRFVYGGDGNNFYGKDREEAFKEYRKVQLSGKLARTGNRNRKSGKK